MSVNLNEIAREMTLMEELKEEVSIAQMKEILRLLFTQYSLEEIAQMYLKYNK